MSTTANKEDKSAKSQGKSKRKLSGDEDFNGLRNAPPTLPANWYFNPDYYEKELENVFYNNWLYLCHQSAFDAVGTFRKFDIGDQSIFLVKGLEGEIKGFHNTCRHRGSAICIDESGKFSNRLIRCPYHQWAYDLNGNLRATSSHVEAPDFHKQDYPLFPVTVKLWRGGVFVSLEDDPAPLEDSFERGSDRTDHWPMEEMVVGHSWRKTMQCNWKIFWENFNECLHCPNIHPELCDLVPIYGRRISYFRDEPNWPEHENSTEPQFRGGLKAGAETWSMNGEALTSRISGLSAEETQRGQSYFVSLPSVFIAAHVDYMRTVRILPLGPEETEITVEWLFLPEQLEDQNFDLENITDFAKLVMLQDADASELNQKGIKSKKYKQGVLMPEEHYVKAFQDWIRKQVA